MRIRFRIQGGFLRDLQRYWEGMRACFWLLLTQWLPSNGVVLRFDLENTSMHDFSFKFFANFFQVWFWCSCSLQPLKLVPLHCICNMECIRSTILDWILVHYGLEIWFDSPLKTFQICPKSIFLFMIWWDTNLMLIMMIIKTWNHQKDLK